MNDLVYYAIVAVILLVVLYAVMLGFKMLQKRVRRNRQGRRIGIVEVLDVDELRQLVLVRRDGVEHLLLIGGDNDLVVESGIHRRSSMAEHPALGEEEPIAPQMTEPRRRMPFAPRRPAPPPPPADEPYAPPHEAEPTSPSPSGDTSPVHEPRIAPPPGAMRD